MNPDRVQELTLSEQQTVKSFQVLQSILLMAATHHISYDNS